MRERGNAEEKRVMVGGKEGEKKKQEKRKLGSERKKSAEKLKS